MRYTHNALLWWLHDAISHPITGTLGLAGRILRSPRLMALGHHIHNATAPNNDAWADYAEAAHRAGCNETLDNPRGSMTPDERAWNKRHVQRTLGMDETAYLSDEEFERTIRNHDISLWEGQASGNNVKPREETRTEQVRNRETARLEREIDERLSADRALNNASVLDALLRAVEDVVPAREKHEIARVLRALGVEYTPKVYPALCELEEKLRQSESEGRRLPLEGHAK